MSKKVKIVLIVLAILVVIGIIWYFLKDSTILGGSGTWTTIPMGDIPNANTNISTEQLNGQTIAQLQAKAVAMGAKAILVNGNIVYYKNTTGPVVTGTTGNYTLYVLN